jgi:hypothetical protein
MWPFKKKRPLPYADELSKAEHAWLQEQRDALASLARAAAIPPSDPLRTTDALIRWWHQQPDSARPDPNGIVNAAGVVLGDALATACNLEWKIITDAYGTDLGLWRAAGNIVLSPTHSVAKRFADCPDGFVAALFPELVVGVKAMDANVAQHP